MSKADEKRDAEVEALRQRMIYDTPFWAEQCAWIVNKQKKFQKLTPLPWQARTPQTPKGVTPLDEALERQRANGMPMRAIILKARKLGFSTWAQAKAIQRVSQLPLQSAITVAHRGDAAARLYKMGKLMYERLPSDQQLADLIYGEGTLNAAPFSIKPQVVSQGTTKSGVMWLELGQKKRAAEASEYQTLTAGSKGGGRSETPNIIHGSEWAHYEDPDYGVGLFNAMPLEAETIGIVESTAKGFNHFYDMWMRAVAGAEDEDLGGTWAPLFYGWQHNPANSLRFLNDRQRERFEHTIGDEDAGGDEDEIELLSDFGVTLEQLNWRRAVKNGPEGGGSIEWFRQEHPTTPEQAFIGSGQPVFPGILVGRAIRDAEKAPKPVEGVLRGVGWREERARTGTIMVPERALWIPPDLMTDEPWWPGSSLTDRSVWASSRLKVWEHPLNEFTQGALPPANRRPDGQYIAGCDTAVGADGTVGEGDWHAISVLDHITHMQVASYRSRIPLHDLPLVLYLVGLYWNEAWLAVEVNSQGKGTVDTLVKDWRYRVMYKTHRAGTDQRTDVEGYKIGWETTQATKPLMEQTMGEAFRDGTHGLRCLVTAREFTTYVQDPKNPAKHGAQRGAHDDSAMAHMIVKRVAGELAPRHQRGGPGDWRPRDPVTGY